MKIITYLFTALFVLSHSSCDNSSMKNDAAGVFEADEVIVSSEIAGRILILDLKEGDRLTKDSSYVSIDATGLQLQKDQVQASIRALQEKTVDVDPQIRLLKEQISVQEVQLNGLIREQRRMENLVKDNAATGKQLDDINTQVDIIRKQIEVTRKQIAVQLSSSGTQNRSVLSEKDPLMKKAAQLQDQVDRGRVSNPVNGTVLARYAMTGEVTAPGKALYKIADLSTLILRAYISGTQLPQVKLGQSVKVLTDDGAKNWKTYPGRISWVSDKAEFTPKTIQTKEERANLVYAMKIEVPNDGYLKIGMYAEVQFK